MFFSSRVNVPACSPLYQDAKDAFLQGDVFRARKLVIEVRKTNQWQMPEDALLGVDISRACGNSRESYATIKIAFKKWPESRIFKLTWAIVLSNRRYTLRSLALLEELFADASEQEKALIAAEFALTYAMGGFRTSARAWIQKCLSFDLKNDPKIYYALACAAYSNRDWENALLYGNQALEYAPHWPRLRTFLADAYLANGEHQRALDLLEENFRKGYRDAYNEWLLGIQHFANGDMGKARDWFSRFEEDWPFSKDCIIKRFHAGSQLDIALKRKDDATVDRLIQDLLEEWPEDAWFHQCKAKHLAKNNTEEAIGYLKDVLSRGIVNAELAQTYLEISEQGLPDVIEILEKAGKSDQGALAECFAYCFERWGAISQKMDFLYWVSENLPHLHSFRAELANELLKNQQNEEAIRIATALHNEDPEAPQLLSLLAECYYHLYPQKALKYWKKAYEYTGSAEYLTQMGYCYHHVNDIDHAKECYWKALDSSPYEIGAMVNLVCLGSYTKKLIEMYFGALEKIYGIYHPAFHVAAIDLANRMKTQVPLKWIDTAIQRYNLLAQQRVVKTDYPEQGLLAKAIATWLRTRNKKSEARKYRTGFSLKQYIKYYDWPGKNWIPAEQ